MIYPDGKPGSIMTDEKISQLQQHNQEGIERCKQSLGTRWLMHPENKVKKVSHQRVLQMIPAFLLKTQ